MHKQALAKHRMALQIKIWINRKVHTMTVICRMICVRADTPRVSIVGGQSARTLPNTSSSAANVGAKMIRANAKAYGDP